MNTPISLGLEKYLLEKGIDMPVQPIIADVVMWVYKNHGIWISVDWMPRTKPFNSGFYCHLRGTSRKLNQDNFIVINNTKKPGYEVFDSLEEAYEVAIKYCLEKNYLMCI